MSRKTRKMFIMASFEGLTESTWLHRTYYAKKQTKHDPVKDR